LGKCIIAAVIAFSAFPAFSGCVDNEELEILRDLKSDFLTGNYDAFFEASDPSAMLPDNVELDTKVNIIQHIGVPTDCLDMVRKRHSESFETLITVFLNDDGQMIFLFSSQYR